MSASRILNFTGNDAIIMARASNRSPEYQEEGSDRWVTGSLWKLSPIASRTPDRVRLRATPRVLAESIMGTAIPRRRQPMAELLSDLSQVLESPVQQEAMAMIVSKMISGK